MRTYIGLVVTILATSMTYAQTSEPVKLQGKDAVPAVRTVLELLSSQPLPGGCTNESSVRQIHNFLDRDASEKERSTEYPDFTLVVRKQGSTAVVFDIDWNFNYPSLEAELGSSGSSQLLTVKSKRSASVDTGTNLMNASHLTGDYDSLQIQFDGQTRKIVSIEMSNQRDQLICR